MWLHKTFMVDGYIQLAHLAFSMAAFVLLLRLGLNKAAAILANMQFVTQRVLIFTHTLFMDSKTCIPVKATITVFAVHVSSTLSKYTLRGVQRLASITLGDAPML